MEIQVNGGTMAQKVDYAYSFFEKKYQLMQFSKKMK